MSGVHETLAGMRRAQEYLDGKRTRGEDSIIRDLLLAVEKVLDIEDWEYKPAVMQGYELDQAEGYNLAMKEVRAAITEALGERP